MICVNSFRHMHSEILVRFFWTELEKWILANTGYKKKFTKKTYYVWFPKFKQ